MSIIKLPNIVLPLQHLDKTNEIIQVLNDNLNMNYSEENPLLTSVEGSCTWTVTHNLGTENVNYSIYRGSASILADVSVASENALTVTFNSASNISAGTYNIVVMANGSGSSSGGGIVTVDSELSTTSTNPVQNRIVTNAIINNSNVLNINTYTDLPKTPTGGYGWTPPSNGFLTFRNEGSSAVKCGVVIANTYVGVYHSINYEEIISFFVTKGVGMWVIPGNSNVLVRFYPAKSGL